MIAIPPEELRFSFIRASGPGGQNVNKVSTAVQLRFDILDSNTLTESQKQLLLENLSHRISKGGEIVITVSASRSQELNRQIAIDRLQEVLTSGLTIPEVRLPTKTPHSAKLARKLNKKRRSETKRLRREKISRED